MVGPDILVSPNPSPDEIAPYEVYLPPGTWYDYWTGERYERTSREQAKDLEQRDKLQSDKPLRITPTLEALPVYVRGGSILPVQPLVQSTAETPQGPLTLRVYPRPTRQRPARAKSMPTTVTASTIEKASSRASPFPVRGQMPAVWM